MKVSTLWDQISLIYDRNNFSSKSLVNGLLIISKDNYYQLYFPLNNGSFSLKIEFDFSITKMMGFYKASILISNPNIKEGEFFDTIPDDYTKILIPILRDFQLDSILE